MKCIEAGDLMEPYLDETLIYKDLEKFIDHIDNCESCRDDLEMLYIIKYGLSDEYAEKNGSYDFVGLFKSDYENAKKRIDDFRKNEFYRSFMCFCVNLIMIIMFIVMNIK